MRQEPVSQAELDDAKSSLVLGLPADFATAGSIAGRLADLSVQGLPDDYWDRYADLVRGVTADDVRRVARDRLDPAHLTAIIVGNPQVVKPQLAGLPIGPVEEQAAPPSPGARAPRSPARSPAPAAGAR